MKITAIAIFMLFVLQATGQTKLVNNTRSLETAVLNARPGDTILLKNMEWKDAGMILNGRGSAEKPIFIMSQTPGGAILTGQSFIRLSGEYLVVKGLHFKNGYTPGKEVISFRTDNEDLANHCRVTETVIENYNQPERFKTDCWVSFWGKYNRVDHCTFADKLNSGPVIIASLDDGRSQQNYHSIDSNYFKGRQRFGSNGGETIRIGVSRYSLTASRTNIVHNYFERCNGEVEIVSVKSGENHVSFNTFYECEGGLVLRHGANNVIEGNLFLGNNKPYTGGVRVINPGHHVFNNVFKDLRGDRFRSALAVLNGVPHSLINRYFQVKDVTIERNTFLNCASIIFGAGKDAERTLSPQNVTFNNNLIVSNEKQLFEDNNKDGGIKFNDNGVVNSILSQLPEGFKNVKTDEVNIKGLSLPFNENYGAAVKQLSFIKKEETGASWYKPQEQAAPRKAKRYVLRSSGSKDIGKIAMEAVKGDTIVLADTGYYKLNEEIIVNKPLVIMAAEGLRSRPVLVNASDRSLPAFITIVNGGALRVKNLAFKGTFESYTDVESAIRSTDAPMNRHYTAIISSCEFYDFNESSYSGFKASKGTLADSLVIVNSIFHNLSGTGVDLAAEKDDKGIYNAEHTIIRNCVFTSMLGSAINIYRGGNDESTLGPFVTIDHCTFNEVENREQGTVVKLIGAQQASVSNCIFSYSGQGGRSVQFEEYRWDDIHVDYCDFYHSGKVESFYNKAAGSHIYHFNPEYANVSKLNFNLKKSLLPLYKSNDGRPLGAWFNSSE